MGKVEVLADAAHSRGVGAGQSDVKKLDQLPFLASLKGTCGAEATGIPRKKGADNTPEGSRFRACPATCVVKGAALLLSPLLVFKRITVVIFKPIFVANHLTVELVHQGVNRRVHVFFNRLDMNVVAPNPQCDFGALTQFFAGELHGRIDHLIKVPFDATQFAGDVIAQCG
jgi:hypothetical protein